MNDESRKSFVHEHLRETVHEVVQLDNFSDSDISVLKRQIVTAIYRIRKMPVAPMEDMKKLPVGYFAIKFIEDELDFKF